MKNQKGFTLIELVVVIVILGILAAVAVPKFVDLQEDAKQAAVKGASAALNSGVALTKAKWLVGNTGSAGLVDLDSDGTNDVYVNASGWVSGAAATAVVDADCDSLWNGIMDANSMQAAASGADFSGAFAAGPICTYTYSGTAYDIVYDSTDGSVTVVIP